jgi:hypothetical protein
VDTLKKQDTWSIKNIRDYPSDEDKSRTVLKKMTHLATWEKLLLQHLVETDSTEGAVWQALTNTTCYISTDGSAPAGKGSYAWMITDSEGEILAQCHGPVYGAKISSHRAYGILSVLRYLLQQFQQVPLMDHSIAPLLPTTGCQLHLAQGITTHDIKRELSLDRAVPPRKAKLCHKHTWSEDEFDMINWVSHGRALNNLWKIGTRIVMGETTTLGGRLGKTIQLAGSVVLR